MVFVTVSEHHTNDVIQTIFKPREIRQNQIDTGLGFFGEKHATINNEEFAIKLQNVHVSTDFSQATQGDNPEASLFQGGRFGQVVVQRHHAISVPRLDFHGPLGTQARSEVPTTSAHHAGPEAPHQT